MKKNKFKKCRKDDKCNRADLKKRQFHLNNKEKNDLFVYIINIIY